MSASLDPTYLGCQCHVDVPLEPVPPHRWSSASVSQRRIGPIVFLSLVTYKRRLCFQQTSVKKQQQAVLKNKAPARALSLQVSLCKQTPVLQATWTPVGLWEFKGSPIGRSLLVRNDANTFLSPKRVVRLYQLRRVKSFVFFNPPPMEGHRRNAK